VPDLTRYGVSLEHSNKRPRTSPVLACDGDGGCLSAFARLTCQEVITPTLGKRDQIVFLRARCPSGLDVESAV